MKAQVPERLLSLDIFRGVTIAAMIMVNNLTFWSERSRSLRLTHAEWNGCNFADLIFPFFIFIVGVSSVFSLERRKAEELQERYRHIVVRTGVIFSLGLLTGSGLIFGWLFQAICPPAETQRASGRSFSPRLPAPRSTSFPWPTCEFRGCCNALPWFICRCRLF